MRKNAWQTAVCFATAATTLPFVLGVVVRADWRTGTLDEFWRDSPTPPPADIIAAQTNRDTIEFGVRDPS
jgi:hypothetical protein